MKRFEFPEDEAPKPQVQVKVQPGQLHFSDRLQKKFCASQMREPLIHHATLEGCQSINMTCEDGRPIIRTSHQITLPPELVELKKLRKKQPVCDDGFTHGEGVIWITTFVASVQTFNESVILMDDEHQATIEAMKELGLEESAIGEPEVADKVGKLVKKKLAEKRRRKK